METAGEAALLLIETALAMKGQSAEKVRLTAARRPGISHRCMW